MVIWSESACSSADVLNFGLDGGDEIVGGLTGQTSGQRIVEITDNRISLPSHDVAIRQLIMCTELLNQLSEDLFVVLMYSLPDAGLGAERLTEQVLRGGRSNFRTDKPIDEQSVNVP
jgi:hypothetical protein